MRGDGHADVRCRPGLVRWVIFGWLAVSVASMAAAQPVGAVGEWRAFGAEPANTKYSPLDQITAENFPELQVALRLTSLSGELAA